MRARPLPPVAAMLLAAAFAGRAWAQGAPTVTIVPAEPVAGQEFRVRVGLPGVEASVVSAPLPSVTGPAAFVASAIRPGFDGDGRSVTLVEFVLKAVEPGSVGIVDLTVRIRGANRVLGSWVVDVRAPAGTARVVPPAASWSAPASVWRWQAFSLAAADADGRAVKPGSVAVAGLALERPPSGDGLAAAATRAGELALPETDGTGPEGPVRIRRSRVTVLPVPPEVEASQAVGSWSVSLSVTAGGDEPRAGDRIAWEARASGRGSVPWAAAPAVSLVAPDGSVLDAGASEVPLREARADGSGWTGAVSLRGAFTAARDGTYTLSLKPYAYLDPADGSVRYARARPVAIRVSSFAAPDWDPPPRASAACLEAIEGAGKGRDSWERALAAAGRGDWAAALASAEEAASGDGRPAAALALAAARLMGGDRARALHALLSIERTAFPPRLAGELADAAAASLGFARRSRDSLPAPGWFTLAGAAAGLYAASAFALAFLARRRGGGRLRGRLPSLVLAAALLAAGGASALQRARERAVSFGAPARAAPAEAAALSFMAPPGAMGRVAARGAGWLFVEFADGRAGWFQAGDAGVY